MSRGPVAFSDLPAGKLRDAALRAYAATIAAESATAPIPSPPAPARRGRRRTEAPTRRADRYRCETCGHRETGYAAAERHADTHGGARIAFLAGTV